MSGSTTSTNVTSVPNPTFDDKGFRVPTEPQVLAAVLTDLQACFGGGLNPALETPQGQLASTATAIISDKNDQFVLLTQNVDPSYASGRMQDGIARIYFLTRYPARGTVVSATCRGLPGTVIAAGAQALATDGNFYSSTVTGTIGTNSTVVIPFQCNTNGPIPCPTGTLTQVYQVTPGWDSITNNVDGELGQNVESRAEFELRRYNSVAGNSMGMLASVQGAVLNIADVLDAYTTENFTGQAVVTTDGITLKPHSIYVCVYGGLAADVGHAIFTKKSPGCDMSGDTTVYVTDTNSGYNPPPPKYAITFQTAIVQTFVMTVTLINSNAVPSTVAGDVQTAIVNAWNGLDGGPRARIGSIVFASRYYGPVALLGSWVQLVSIKLASDIAPAASFTGSIAGNGSVLTVASLSSGTLAAGQTITGVGRDGVQITSQASGPAGGVGTYNLDTTFANAVGVPTPVAMTAIPLTTLDDVQVGIGHVPIISAANINVVLQ